MFCGRSERELGRVDLRTKMLSRRVLEVVRVVAFEAQSVHLQVKPQVDSRASIRVVWGSVEKPSEKVEFSHIRTVECR